MSNIMGESSGSSSSLTAAINSSNIGFQLLKKHGWKEGTGLGIAQQVYSHLLRSIIVAELVSFLK